MPAQQESGPDISRLSLELQSQWDHELNAHLGNVVIKPHSMRKAWWTCMNCPDEHIHRWETNVQKRTVGTGCPYCSGHAVCSHNSLARKAPHIAKDWDVAENPDSPHDYTAGSDHCPHWVCPLGHQWQVAIRSRVYIRSGCPVCARQQPRPKLPVLTASPSHILQLWDWERNTRNGLDPNRITCGSNLKVHLRCNKCPCSQPHQWTAMVSDIVKGRGCPYCSGRRVCKCNCLQTIRPDLAAAWCHARNSGTPTDYTANCKAVVWWETDKRGVWRESINRRFINSPRPEIQVVHLAHKHTQYAGKVMCSHIKYAPTTPGILSLLHSLDKQG